MVCIEVESHREQAMNEATGRAGKFSIRGMVAHVLAHTRTKAPPIRHGLAASTENRFNQALQAEGRGFHGNGGPTRLLLHRFPLTSTGSRKKGIIPGTMVVPFPCERAYVRNRGQEPRIQADNGRPKNYFLRHPKRRSFPK